MGQAGIIINLILMLLNIIPIPPLDGSRIVSSFLSNKADYYYSRLEPYGFIILLVLLATGILARILGPGILFCLRIIGQIVGLPFNF
jgi:Zn-dependent protease